jgi:dihydrofolate reductase
MSLDGFLASKDDDLSWMSFIEKDGEDYGYADHSRKIDTYIVGRVTYDVVLKLTGGVFPQAEQWKCYVLTREKRPDKKNVTFYNGNIVTLIQTLKAKEGGDIYCDGGGQAVKLLLEHDLIDEFVISVIPIILGEGKRLFLGDTPGLKLKALPVREFDSGVVQLHYTRETV